MGVLGFLLMLTGGFVMYEGGYKNLPPGQWLSGLSAFRAKLSGSGSSPTPTASTISPTLAQAAGSEPGGGHVVEG